MNYLVNFWQELVYLTMEMAPYLLLGFLFAGILYAWFPAEKVFKYLGKRNFRSVLNASLIGIPLPLCSCGVIPTGISFFKNGASKGASVSFLISTPQTGVDSIMVTWSLLGWPLAVIRPVIALFTGIFGGILTNRNDRGHDEEIRAKETLELNVRNKKTGLIGMLRYAFVDFLQDIVKWLVLGLIIAAAMAVIIPDDFFTDYISNDYISMLAILIASIPLYVCATGSVPIAAVLIMKGLSPGAAIVFLMAGPATNAATISVIGSAMGRKTLITYLFSIITGALFFGILINEILPRDFFLRAMSHLHHGQHEHGFLPYWLQAGSAVILSIFMLNGLVMKYLYPLFIKMKEKPLSADKMRQLTVYVGGMTCSHCKATVETNLGKIEGVDHVRVDLSSGNVTLQGDDLNIPEIKKTVTGLGYTFRA